jgi:hypothetical protein
MIINQKFGYENFSKCREYKKLKEQKIAVLMKCHQLAAMITIKAILVVIKIQLMSH